MRTSLKYALLSSALTLAPLTAGAQQAVEQIDEVIVTGTRIPTAIENSGTAISVVTAEEIETRQQRFVLDALKSTPGVQVTQSGSFGGLASVSIRGLESDQTMVVVDGIEVNNPASFGNSFNFATFDTADIERIEILRGAQSALYGSDAIAGVINIVTKAPEEGLAASGQVEGGAFGTARATGSLSGGAGRVSGRLTVASTRSDGFSSADEDNGNTEDDGYENLTVSGKLRVDATEALRLETLLRYADSENDFDSFIGGGMADGPEVGETKELVAAGSASLSLFDGMWDNRVSLSYTRNDQLNTNAGATTFDSLGERLTYAYEGTLEPIDAATVVVGVEREEAESRIAVGFGANDETTTNSTYGLLQLRPIDRVTLSVGLRRDWNSRYGNETTASSGVAVDFPETDTTLRGSYQEGFRAPTLSELGFNPDLFAERSTSWDIGVEQRLMNGRLRLGATYFNNQVDDLIGFDLATFNFYNIEEYESRGLELALNARLRDNLTLSASYTFLDAENVSTNTPAPNQPDHRATFDVAYRPIERLTLSANVTYNGKEPDGSTTLNAYTLVGVRAAYAVKEDVEIFGRIENLTNADYQDNFGFGTAPISAYAGVKARF